MKPVNAGFFIFMKGGIQKMPGLLVAYEGVEGSGKSSAISPFAALLRAQGFEVIETKEPGGTPLANIIRQVLLANRSEVKSASGTVIAEAIRETLLASDPDPMHNDTELLLMFASRAQHYHLLVKPALDRGAIVLTDRWVASSRAIQGSARGMPMERIEAMKEFVLGSFEPDMTILFDLPVEVGAARANKRAALDRIESEGPEFFNRVRNGFLEQAKASPERFRMINAEVSIPEVQAQLEALIPEIVALARG
jgi:dTMP kinase